MLSIFKKKYIVFSIILIVLSLTSCNNNSQTGLVDVHYPQPASRRFELANGMTVILSENHNTPFVAVEVLVKVGSSLEGEFTSSGISHFVEHMLFKGTKKMPAGKVEDRIRSLGADTNGFTSFDYTGYTITAPKQYLREVLELLSDILANPSFLKGELEKERHVILKEIDMNYDEPQRRLNQLFYKNFYATHPYRYPIIGNNKFLLGISRDDILRFYKRHYAANNIVVSIAGDITADKAEELVKKTMGGLRAAPVHPVVLPVEPEQIAFKYNEENYEGRLTYLMMGFHSVSLSDEDLFALDLLSSILGGTDSSRLFGSLYQKKSLVYSINSYNYTPRFPGVFTVSAIVRENKQGEVIDGIYDEIEKIKKGGVSKEEMNLSKNNLILSYVSNLETIQSQASDFAASEALTGNFRFSSHYIEKIKKVTKREIIEAARKYLKRDNSAVSILKPVSNGAIGKKELQKTRRDITGKVTLKNGLRIVYSKRKDYPKVSLTVALKGGLLAESRNTNGISNMASGMLLKGTTSKNSEDIQKIIESYGAAIEAFSGNNSFGIKVDMLDRNIDKVIDIICEIMRRPSLPEEEFKKEKALTKAKILERDDDIYSSTALGLKQLLYNEHPYELDILGTAESLERIKRKDVADFYKNYIVSNNIVISVAGNIDEKKILSFIKRKFGPIRPKNVKLFDGDGGISNTVLFKSKEMPKKEAVIMMGFRAPSITSDDRYGVEILESILSGADGRLFQEIRQKRALSYTQGAFYVPALISGYFIIYASVNKDNVDLAKGLLFKEIEKLKHKGITEYELATAKNKLLSKHWLSLQRNSDLSARMAMDELYGLGYDNFKLYSGNLEPITVSDVSSIVNKYFDLKSCVISATLPAE